MFRFPECSSFLLAVQRPKLFLGTGYAEKETQFMIRSSIAVLIFTLVAALGLPVFAQDFPTGRIRLVVPSPAGAPPDTVSRIVANQIAESRGWQLIAENKPGAAQTIGLAEVLKRPADGYTLAAIALSSTAAPALLPEVPFRLERDFAPVIKLAAAYHVLVVNPSVPATSLRELVSLLKANPDKMTFSSGGFGTPAHLAGEMFKLQTGVRARHVPYKGLSQAIPDLLNGTNQFQFITPLPVLDLISTGKLRALAVTGPRRLPALPNVPTVAEAGFSDLIIQDWFGIVVKSGTASDTVLRLNKAFADALAEPGVRSAIDKLAAEPAGGTPAEFGEFITSQLRHWARVVKDSGIQIHQ
jgi:tripartite-type tricarboxylate transporter receptor subunit TctC